MRKNLVREYRSLKSVMDNLNDRYGVVIITRTVLLFYREVHGTKIWFGFLR